LWFDLIGAWLKEPFVINLWLAAAPAPAAEPIPIHDALFKVFKAFPNYCNPEVGRVLKGGRGTGYLNFFLALGLVIKIKTPPSAFDDFSLISRIKGRRYQWTQSWAKLKCLLKALASEEPFAAPSSEAAEPEPPLLNYSRFLHRALQRASEQDNIRLSNSSYVRAHLVRKLLVLRMQKEGEWDRFCQLSWSDFTGLELPDEDNFLAAVPENLRNVGMLEVALSCPPLLLTCFACLAKPALKKNPNLLEKLTKAGVEKDLEDYKTMHGFNPSLERLFFWRAGDQAEERQSLPEAPDSSDESP